MRQGKGTTFVNDLLGGVTRLALFKGAEQLSRGLDSSYLFTCGPADGAENSCERVAMVIGGGAGDLEGRVSASLDKVWISLRMLHTREISPWAQGPPPASRYLADEIAALWTTFARMHENCLESQTAGALKWIKSAQLAWKAAKSDARDPPELPPPLQATWRPVWAQRCHAASWLLGLEERDSNHPAAAAAAWEEQKVYTGSLHDVTPFVRGAARWWPQTARPRMYAVWIFFQLFRRC
jgi:hypothetical protein